MTTIYINAHLRVCNSCGRATSVNLDYCQHCGTQKVQVIYPPKSLPQARPARELAAA